MVGEGMGSTLIPQLAVPEKNNGEVRYLPFAAPQPSRRIGMLYRKGSYRAETFAAIGNSITVCLAI